MIHGGGAARTGGHDARRNPAGMAGPIGGGNGRWHDAGAAGGGPPAGAGRHRKGGAARSPRAVATPAADAGPRQRRPRAGGPQDRPGGPGAPAARSRPRERRSAFEAAVGSASPRRSRASWSTPWPSAMAAVVAAMTTARPVRSVAAAKLVERPTVERPPTGGAGRVGGGLDRPAGPRSGPSASGTAGTMPATTAARGPVRRSAGGRTGGTGAGGLRRAGGGWVGGGSIKAHGAGTPGWCRTNWSL